MGLCCCMWLEKAGRVVPGRGNQCYDQGLRPVYSIACGKKDGVYSHQLCSGEPTTLGMVAGKGQSSFRCGGWQGWLDLPGHLRDQRLAAHLPVY